jgi:hypothetical protein
MVIKLTKTAKKPNINKLLNSVSLKRGKKLLDAKKYCGILKIKGEPTEIIRKMRNEW